MSHIYLCYSNQDKELVDLIQDDLKERGYVVWRDTTHIQAAQDWGQALAEALNSAYTVVVAASTQSIGSDVVQRELNCAAEANLPVVVVVLDSCNVPDVWQATAVALGNIGDPSAIGPLIDQLADSDRFVRAAVVEALGKLKATSAVNQIVHIMRNDPISDVRAAAQDALCHIGGPQAQRALLRAGVQCEETAS